MGEANVEGLLRRITAKQFRAWEHFYELEPFGYERISAELAQIAQMIFNMAVSVDDRQPLSEFLLAWGSEPKPKNPQTFEEQIAIAKIMSEAAAAEHRELAGRKPRT